MGALLGLVLGLGLFLVWQSFGPARPPRPGRVTLGTRVQEMLLQAGIDSVTPVGLLASSVAVGVVALVLTFGISGSFVVSLAFALIASYAPMATVRYRRNQRQSELRELWPEVVDNLASSVRAGLSLPEAISQIGIRGPATVRPAFQRFGEDYRATGRFNVCLDRLKGTLADPTGDRIVESLRMAREVGGSDLGRLLRTLSAFLREDARTRAELETRQGWTVNAARLAVAAPWVVLLFMAFNREMIRPFDSPAGFLVIAVGAGVILVAYRIMVRIARLPTEDRVLR